MSIASQKVTVTSTTTNGTTTVSAATTDASLGDVLSTALSTDSAVTGLYGLAQRAGLFVAGMAVNSYRYRGSFNPFKSAI